jgi:adenosine deaminase
VALFHRLGIRATVNTDNRLMSGVSVASEVHQVASVNGFRWTDIEAVQVTGIQSAFCSLDERRRIEHEVIRPAYAKLEE